MEKSQSKLPSSFRCYDPSNYNKNTAKKKRSSHKMLICNVLEKGIFVVYINTHSNWVQAFLNKLPQTFNHRNRDWLTFLAYCFILLNSIKTLNFFDILWYVLCASALSDIFHSCWLIFISFSNLTLFKMNIVIWMYYIYLYR